MMRLDAMLRLPTSELHHEPTSDDIHARPSTALHLWPVGHRLPRAREAPGRSLCHLWASAHNVDGGSRSSHRQDPWPALQSLQPRRRAPPGLTWRLHQGGGVSSRVRMIRRSPGTNADGEVAESGLMRGPAKAVTRATLSVGSNPTLSARVMSRESCKVRTSRVRTLSSVAGPTIEQPDHREPEALGGWRVRPARRSQGAEVVDAVAAGPVSGSTRPGQQVQARSGWDSNPRTLAGRRLSRPLPSSTRPPLRTGR